MRRAVLAIVLTVLVVCAQAQPPGPPQKGAGPGKPLTPQEAVKLFKLDAGLRIELVACEPQVESPVAMQFDPDGKLWVVEMRDYPNGPAKGEKPAGRIRVLEDKDGDGFFETSTIWADNLLFANGILLWKDGAIVTMAPKITHLRDTKGAGKADKEDLLYVGFAEQNPQLRVSHPILGLDGWIYCANGLRGGKVIQASGQRKLDGGANPDGAKHQPADAGRSPVDLSGMDFRFDPVHLDKYEAITGPGQYGNTFDEWGNRFVCDNRHHLRHVVMENRYVKRNPYLAAPLLLQDVSVLEDGPLSSGGKVYPLSKNWTTSSLHEGRFTAACGVFIYHGQLLANGQRKLAGDKAHDQPKHQPAGDPAHDQAKHQPVGDPAHDQAKHQPVGDPTRDQAKHQPAGDPTHDQAKHQPANAGRSPYYGAAFTCEPTGNLVHMEILTPKGATFEARPHKKGVEFLATTDDWFRPVFLTHGPEGAMYVVDMYRAVIEHPEFMPPELKNRPDLWQGKDKGRIWRIVPKDHKTKTPRPGLSKASIADLVKALEHEEPWHRQTAQRLLLEKNDKAMVEPLTKLLETTKSPHAKILAAWLLERQGALPDLALWSLTGDRNRHLVEQAIRIAEPRIEQSKTLKDALTRVLASNGPADRARFQAILSLGGLDDKASIAIFAYGVLRLGDDMDQWTELAALSASANHAMPILTRLASQSKPSQSGTRLTKALATAIVSHGNANDYLETLRLLWLDRPMKWAGIAGMTEGLERRGKTLVSVTADLPEYTRKIYVRDYTKIFEDASARVNDAKHPVEERLHCIRILGHAPGELARQQLSTIVQHDQLPSLRIAALRALAAQQEKEVPTVLIKLWPAATPSLRREILEAMLRQPVRVNVLLDEIEAKRMKASELDPLRTRQLLNHKDTAIRTRAAKLLASNIPADRAKVLKEYQTALELKGDAARGREIFKKECSICHRVAGIGVDVGPDIADTRTKTLSAMLNDILIPNAAIDANYVNYVVSTKDGRIVTGMMAVETASSITLKRAEGQTDVVLRKDIDEIASTGVSLMPDGLEKNIPPQAMADLLAFLKNWRYLDGSVPIK